MLHVGDRYFIIRLHRGPEIIEMQHLHENYFRPYIHTGKGLQKALENTPVGHISMFFLRHCLLSVCLWPLVVIVMVAVDRSLRLVTAPTAATAAATEEGMPSFLPSLLNSTELHLGRLCTYSPTTHSQMDSLAHRYTRNFPSFFHRSALIASLLRHLLLLHNC